MLYAGGLTANGFGGWMRTAECVADVIVWGHPVSGEQLSGKAK